MFLKHNKITIGGKKVHYVTFGSGPPLILVHALFASWEMFREEFLNPLATHFQIVAVDLPGFGCSETLKEVHTLDNYVLFVKKFLDKLKLSEVHYFGSSLGGIIGLKFAAKYPYLLRKLSVQAPPFYYKYVPVLKTEKPLLILIETFPFLLSIIRDLVENEQIWKIMRNYIEDINDAVSALGEEKVKTLIERISKQALVEVFAEIGKLDIREEIHKIPVETQIIVGSKDAVLPLYRARQLHSYLLSGKLKIIPEGEHHVIIKNPEQCAKNLLQFLISEKRPRTRAEQRRNKIVVRLTPD